MEREMVQVRTAGMVPPDSSRDRTIVNEFGGIADEVYIFVNPNEPGIKFVDSRPNDKGENVDLRNSSGVYSASLSSIDVVDWDKDINVPNGTTSVTYSNGQVTITTIMVSEETLKAILQDIDRQMLEGKSIITIDIHILTRKKNMNDNIIPKSDIVLNEEEPKDLIDKYSNDSNKIETDDLKEKDNDQQMLEKYKKLYNEVKNVQDYFDSNFDKKDLDKFNKYNEINNGDDPKSI